ncbi:hypothetical protein [Bacterioplanes sanyensis]|nr:hypothetical protein [Bacterioplanes sanyensis]
MIKWRAHALKGILVMGRKHVFIAVAFLVSSCSEPPEPAKLLPGPIKIDHIQQVKDASGLSKVRIQLRGSNSSYCQLSVNPDLLQPISSPENNIQSQSEIKCWENDRVFSASKGQDGTYTKVETKTHPQIYADEVTVAAVLKEEDVDYFYTLKLSWIKPKSW